MAIRETLELDLSRALSQLDDLERQLDGLLQPLDIPVTIDDRGALEGLQRDIRAADNENIDIDVDDRPIDRAEDELEEFRREADRTEDELQDLEQRSDKTARSLEDIGKRGKSAFGGVTAGVLALGAAVAVFQGARALTGFFVESIGSASDLEESLSKTNVVFGEFTDDIEEFASTAPEALGLANAAALEFTATFGNLFVALGLSQEAAADLAPDIVQLGADLASFNNIDVTEALEKLRAGLVGEAEPLRVLGVNLTAAATAAKAVELGLAASTGEVSEAAKVQARYALILEQTATAQGDFERTAEGIANTQRTLTAEFENFRASVGQALLPLYESLLELAPQVLEGLEDLIPTLEELAVTLAGFVEDDGADFIQFLTDILRVGPEVVGDFGRLGSSIGGVASAFANLGSGGNLTDLGNSIFAVGDAIDSIKLGQLETGLVNRLRAGEDAAQALESQLLGLDDIDLTIEGLAEVAGDFAQLADLDPGAAARLSLQFLRLGGAAGFTAEEIRAIRLALLELSDADPRGIGLNFDRGQRRAVESEAAAAAAITEAQALDVLSGVADETGVSLAELLADTENLPPEFAALTGQLSGSTISFLQSVDRLEEVKSEIGTLPGAMEAARLALRDEEGEIVEDFGSFFDNLLEELEAREAFESNLAILRALGLDDLATIFDEAGLEAASALADAVSNPAEAATAEAELQGFGEQQGAAYVNAMEEAIRGQPVTQGLIANIVTAAEQADSPEVQAALLALANSLQLEIPVTFGEPTGSIDIRSRLPEFTPTAGGGTTIINNTFESTPNPTTDTARIEQAVSSVTGRAV